MLTSGVETSWRAGPSKVCTAADDVAAERPADADASAGRAVRAVHCVEAWAGRGGGLRQCDALCTSGAVLATAAPFCRSSFPINTAASEVSAAVARSQLVQRRHGNAYGAAAQL